MTKPVTFRWMLGYVRRKDGADIILGYVRFGGRRGMKATGRLERAASWPTMADAFAAAIDAHHNAHNPQAICALSVRGLQRRVGSDEFGQPIRLDRLVALRYADGRADVVADVCMTRRDVQSPRGSFRYPAEVRG